MLFKDLIKSLFEGLESQKKVNPRLAGEEAVWNKQAREDAQADQ
jgi:hypothetical protein